MKISLYLIIIACFFNGGFELWNAPDSISRIFSMLNILCGVIAMGFAGIIEALEGLKKQDPEPHPKSNFFEDDA